MCSPSPRCCPVELSSMVDIQFSAYHYKTGDIPPLKYSKYREIKKKICCPRLPVDFYGWIFFMVILVLYRKLYTNWFDNHQPNNERKKTMKIKSIAIAIATIALAGAMHLSVLAQDKSTDSVKTTESVNVGSFSVDVPTDWKKFTAQESAIFERQYRQQSRDIYEHFAGGDDPSKSVHVAAYHTPGNNGSFVIVSMSLPAQADLMPMLKEQIEPKMKYGIQQGFIKKYLGIIKKEHNTLVTISKRGKYQIDTGLLDQITLTTKNRRNIKYDLKDKYPRISTDELQECRESAVSTYKSYLELSKIQNAQLAIDRPRKEQGSFSRTILYNGGTRGRFSLNNAVLSLRDSMDTNWSIIHGVKQKVIHNRLKIPLKLGKYHLEQIAKGNIASLRFSERDGVHYANFSINSQVEIQDLKDKPKAVMGIDLGINKTAFSVVMTNTGIQHRRTWHSDNKFQELSRLEDQIASLQRESNYRINHSIPRGNIRGKLTDLKDKRKIISLEYDRLLVQELVDHIVDVTQSFNLQIGIGKLKGIRKRGRKGNGKGKMYRKRLHSWAFFRFTEMLEHKLSEIGLKHKLFAVNEAWTSIMCYKCNTKGIRPSQSFFKCLNSKCGVRNNADFNGAMNIAKRTVKYRKLTPESTWGKVGLGRFLRPYQAKGSKNTPKAHSRKRRRSSNTIKKNLANPVPVSVVTKQSISIDSFENDLAMVKKYGKTILVGPASSNQPSGRKRHSLQRDE